MANQGEYQFQGVVAGFFRKLFAEWSEEGVCRDLYSEKLSVVRSTYDKE